MRAKGTLALICALLGATVMVPIAEAATRESRNATKQARPGQAAAQAPSRPAAQPARTAAKPAEQRGRQVAALPVPPTPPRAAPAVRVVTPAATPVAMRAPLNPPPVARHIPPQEPARAIATALPLGRAQAAAMPGTPILPVSITSGLSCVPFARMATGMNISGNGGQWWHNAAGIYARGNLPERGAVLAMPGSGGMRMGHVAVVSRVVNSRTIEVDHANWGGPGLRRGQVLRGAVVIDVSDRNDWSAVRHQVGFDRDTFGRTYPVQGFIYNRPANERSILVRAPAREEVAEVPSPHVVQHMRLTAQLFGN